METELYQCNEPVLIIYSLYYVISVDCYFIHVLYSHVNESERERCMYEKHEYDWAFIINVVNVWWENDLGFRPKFITLIFWATYFVLRHKLDEIHGQKSQFWWLIIICIPYFEKHVIIEIITLKCFLGRVRYWRLHA